MWICPNCGRQFRDTNQDHSCLTTDVDSHFLKSNPLVKRTYSKMSNGVLDFEGVEVNPLKNAILFRTKSTFLAAKPKKDYLEIEFLLGDKTEEFPIYKTFQATKSKFAHFVRLGTPEEVDAQLLDWLRKAWELSL